VHAERIHAHREFHTLHDLPGLEELLTVPLPPVFDHVARVEERLERRELDFRGFRGVLREAVVVVVGKLE